MASIFFHPADEPDTTILSCDDNVVPTVGSEVYLATTREAYIVVEVSYSASTVGMTAGVTVRLKTD